MDLLVNIGNDFFKKELSKFDSSFDKYFVSKKI